MVIQSLPGRPIPRNARPRAASLCGYSNQARIPPGSAPGRPNGRGFISVGATSAITSACHRGHARRDAPCSVHGVGKSQATSAAAPTRPRRDRQPTAVRSIQVPVHEPEAPPCGQRGDCGRTSEGELEFAFQDALAAPLNPVLRPIGARRPALGRRAAPGIEQVLGLGPVQGPRPRSLPGADIFARN